MRTGIGLACTVQRQATNSQRMPLTSGPRFEEMPSSCLAVERKRLVVG